MADPVRLEQMVATLTPLAQMQRGRLIRAQDWNDIVVALLDVVRTVFGAAAADDGVPAHAHLDQVNDGWLAETLRQRIAQGAQPLHDRLAAVERRLRMLADDLDGRFGDLDDVRGRLGGVETRDLARGKDLTGLRTIVDGVRQSQTDVGDLRASFARIETRVAVASALADRLVIDGEPVDMGAIAGRIRAVEVLRDRMRTPSGELLDAAAIEGRLATADNRFATKAELSEVAAHRGAGLTDIERVALEDRIRTAVAGELDTRVRESETRIRAVTEAGLAGVDGRIDARIGEAGAALRTAVLTAAAADAERRLAAANEAALAGVTARFAEVERTFQTLLSARIDEVSNAIRTTVATAIGAEATAMLAQARAAARAEVESTATTLRAEMRVLARDRADPRLELVIDPRRGGTDP